MKLIGESAMRSEAHRARGKRNQNKQLVRSANSLIEYREALSYRREYRRVRKLLPRTNPTPEAEYSFVRIELRIVT